MEIGIIGAGNVGRALAAGWDRAGHQVSLGARTPSKLEQWRQQHPAVLISSPQDVASRHTTVVLSVPGVGAEEALADVAEHLSDAAVLIDTCDPFASLEPTESVLPLFTSSDESLLERLQLVAPHVRMVKTFNTVGAQFMAFPDFPGGPPSMFLCGDDADARSRVAGLIADLGWDPVDVGTARSARVLEPMASLYCAMGHHSGEWDLAFKVLRMSPGATDS